MPQPDEILDWLQKEMGYRPLGPYITSSKASMPSVDSLRRILRGNMIPVWNFLLKRVKSEKTVENIRRNILVHGGQGIEEVEALKKTRDRRRKETVTNLGGGETSREAALHERDASDKEVEKLRQVVRRQRKELKARMLELSKEEAERKRMLDERSNYRCSNVCVAFRF